MPPSTEEWQGIRRKYMVVQTEHAYTVKELIEALQKVPQELLVTIESEGGHYQAYVTRGSIRVEETEVVLEAD